MFILVGTCSDDRVRGYYRIKAIDFWDRAGEYSVVTSYGVQQSPDAIKWTLSLTKCKEVN